MTKRSPKNKEMFTLLKVVGERARSPTTFVMITNHFCQLYRISRASEDGVSEENAGRRCPKQIFDLFRHSLGAVAQRLGVRS